MPDGVTKITLTRDMAIRALKHMENIDVGFCPMQFREYFLCRFSETKNSRKLETGTRHLVNSLVKKT